MKSDPSLPITDTFPFVPKPVRGEHVLGYVRRLCEANDMDSLRPFWLSTGLTNLSPWSADPFWRQLQCLTGLPDELIRRLRWSPTPSDSAVVELAGSQIRKSFLVTGRLRHCPSCLQEDGVLRPSWSVYHVTACARHAAQLRDTCDECEAPLPLHSRTMAWGCVQCAADLRSARPKPASTGELAFANEVESYFDGGSESGLTHPDFQSLSLNRLVTMADRFGTLAAATVDVDQPTQLDRTRYGLGNVDQSGGIASASSISKAGFSVLQEWPKAFHDLIATFVDRNPAPVQKNLLRRRFATEYGLLAIKPILDHDGSQIEMAIDELKRFCLERLDYRWGQRWHFYASKRSAAQNGEVSGRLAEAVNVMKERQRQSSGSKITMAAPLSLSIKSAMLRLEGDLEAAPGAWFRSGLLSGHKHQVEVSRAEVDNLVTRLSALPTPSTPISPIRISDLPRLQRPYERWRFLEEIFSGLLPVYKMDARNHLGELHIDGEELAERQAFHRLKALLRTRRFVQLHHVKGHFETLWGPLALMTAIEARQWIARGILRYRYDAPIYGKRSFPRYFFDLEDLIRITQRMYRPIHFIFEGDDATLTQGESR